MEKIKARFIINPISGTGKQKLIEKLLPLHLNEAKFEYEICYTEAAKHAFQLSKDAVKKGFNLVVAVGGDGSAHECGRSLINTDTCLGIIPVGSGNGLARNLNIPIDVVQSIELLNNYEVKKIDTVNVNNEAYLGMAGVGFDAHIGHEFSKVKKRGLWSYIKIITKEIPSYKSGFYIVKTNGQNLKYKAFLISLANSSQYGNNAIIAPTASITDGKVDICILKKFPAYAVPGLALSLFKGNINQSRFLETIKSSEFTISQNTEIIHLDGEPYVLGKELNFKVNPLSLKVAVPMI